MIRLGPGHDAATLAPGYARHHRLQIRDFLAEADAERILKALTENTPWGVAFNDGTRVIELDRETVGAMSPGQSDQLVRSIHERARAGYQFLYNYYPLYVAYFSHAGPRNILFDVFEFLNSPGFLNYARRLTGLPTIRWADAHATLYRAGHFLKYHTDETPSQRRLAAYVLNFTKGWGRDWGGYLQFFNDRYDIEEAYRPVFNALNIFTVPADHSVGMISSYAPSGRYSITGWLREDEPPGPIPR